MMKYALFFALFTLAITPTVHAQTLRLNTSDNVTVGGAGTIVTIKVVPVAKATKPHPGHPRPTTPPGGTNQVQGLNGKIGDVLFDGHWRFQVLSIDPVSIYTLTVPSSEQNYAKYYDTAELDVNTYTFTPKTGYTFFAVKCHVKNGQKSTEQIDGFFNNPMTALTDDKENSYSPIAYDMMSKGNWITKELLPGSGEDLTLLFAVPPGTTPKDLVFTLKNWSGHAGHNVRVSLAPKA